MDAAACPLPIVLLIFNPTRLMTSANPVLLLFLVSHATPSLILASCPPT